MTSQNEEKNSQKSGMSLLYDHKKLIIYFIEPKDNPHIIQRFFDKYWVRFIEKGRYPIVISKIKFLKYKTIKIYIF